MAAPEELNSLMELGGKGAMRFVLPRFATQTLPAPSMAIPSGILRPPPVYPAELEMGELEEASRLILFALDALSATHTLPEASMAMPQGSASPPPV
jgi:hypothetical protein